MPSRRLLLGRRALQSARLGGASCVTPRCVSRRRERRPPQGDLRPPQGDLSATPLDRGEPPCDPPVHAPTSWPLRPNHRAPPPRRRVLRRRHRERGPAHLDPSTCGTSCQKSGLRWALFRHLAALTGRVSRYRFSCKAAAPRVRRRGWRAKPVVVARASPGGRVRRGRGAGDVSEPLAACT